MVIHDLPPHCDRPGCCVGVIRVRCRQCGFVGFVNAPCPATEDDMGEPMFRMGEPVFLGCEAPGYNAKVRF